MKKIGAAWMKTGEKGKFLSGQVEIGGAKYTLMIFPNDRKQTDRHPDYIIMSPVETEAEKVSKVFDGQVVKDEFPF